MAEQIVGERHPSDRGARLQSIVQVIRDVAYVDRRGHPRMIRSRGTPVNAEARAMDKVNLAEAFASFSDPWNPRIAGDINSFQVKLVKLAGAFDWHHHE